MAQAVALQENEKGGTGQEVLASFEKPRIPWHPRLEEAFGVDRALWKTIIDTVFPGAKSADSIVNAIRYCRARDLDVMKRPVHIVSMWSTSQNRMVETVWPGIGELRTTATRTEVYAGCDETSFGPNVTKKFDGEVDVWESGRKTGTRKIEAEVTFPEWAQVNVYRIVHGQRVKFAGPKVYWLETYASVGKTDVPNEMWKDRPIGQLDKCAEAAALRKAFPEETAGSMTAEEMAGKKLDEIEGQGALVTPETTVVSLAPARAPDPEPAKVDTSKTTIVSGPMTIPAGATVMASDVEAAKIAPAAHSSPLKAPDLPAFLDRTSESKLPQAVTGEPRATDPAPAADMEDPPLEEAMAEEIQETAEDVIKEAEDHFASAKSEDEIDQFYTEGDFEARLEPFVGGVEKARSLRDEAKRRLASKPDPFLIPDRFRDSQHVSDWVDAAIAATGSAADAEKLRAIWGGSKARRAEVLTTETNKPIFDKIAAAVAKFSTVSTSGTGTGASQQPTAASPAPALDPTEVAQNAAQYFAQAEAVLTWDDPDKLWHWTNETAPVREDLGIGQDERWKKMKSRLIDRRDVLKAKKGP